MLFILFYRTFVKQNKITMETYREIKLTDRFPLEEGQYNFKSKGSNLFTIDTYFFDEDKSEYLSRYESWLEAGDNFIEVGEQEPPHNIELLVKSPSGTAHISSWRPAYNIFDCQCKSESSYKWKWKLI